MTPLLVDEGGGLSASTRLAAHCLTATIRGVSLSAAPCGRFQCRVGEGIVDRVDGRSWRDDLVDAVEDRGVEDDVAGRELGFELLHGARAEDGGSDGWVVEHEGDRHLDERDSNLVCEDGELLDGVELALIRRLGEIEALG